MDQATYNSLYAEAARTFPRITHKALREIQIAYASATAEVAEALSNAILTGKADITVASLQSLLEQLAKSYKTVSEQIALETAITQKITQHIPEWPAIQLRLSAAAESIRIKLETIIPDTVRAGNEIITDIHELYLADIVDLSSGRITTAGLANMFSGVNDLLVSNIAGRIWLDGYGYSTRIWNVGLKYQDDIKRVVLSGLAQGRDIIDIAKDLNQYVRPGGYQKLMQRYGPLRRGTAAFARRIRKNVFYPSIRLVRSELYASLQENSKYMGLINPAASEMYRWIRSTIENYGCACPELAAGSPYSLQNLPSYPHSNCLCGIQPILRNTQEFKNDLKTWANGGPVDYIDKWYNGTYLTGFQESGIS